VCQFPPDTNELFNAFWSSTQSGWTDERDFFEGHSQTGVIDTDWIYQTGSAQDYYVSPYLGFDPSAAMHRYTYAINPDQSWSFYIDGSLQTWVNGGGDAPARGSVDALMALIINYALSATTFTDSRSFVIDSVALYQDGAHAGKDIAGGGIAAGTTLQ
jgi:Glycosyl hydrolases family 16